jgi:hypothetical protein
MTASQTSPSVPGYIGINRKARCKQACVCFHQVFCVAHCEADTQSKKTSLFRFHMPLVLLVLFPLFQRSDLHSMHLVKEGGENQAEQNIRVQALKRRSKAKTNEKKKLRATMNNKVNRPHIKPGNKIKKKSMWKTCNGPVQ